ncbi:HD-GYP domain-containing protein [Actinoallomurus rhizosphaericola]|uniref:HD-GYP domain-containing protein n=1 Tax=Actinoallomurus rhizosphaericola TaxID=2952536 RepID=UPI0020908088|nr:HD domain-containing phosphohydrolase [Actinoallomurus rhizosphaericola]MCO5991745.1 HD domain-containing protein [Actinoallomurus rhizosphaericola]
MTAPAPVRRRTIGQALDSAQLLLSAVAGLLVIGSVTQVAAVGVVDSRTAVLFGALIAVGELLRMNVPGNREVAPIASAGALGYALLLKVGAESAAHSAFQVVTVTACGTLAGALPHIAVGRIPKLDALARRILTPSVVAFIFRPIMDSSLREHWPALITVMVLTVILSCVIDISVAAVIRTEAVRARFGIALGDEIQAMGPLCAASGATGMLLAVSTFVMGPAALLVFTAPILVTQVAFRRFAGIRATYLQTVRALSQVTEVGGYVEAGHSRRVSRLAVAMGRELGMTEEELLELEYAALMHDIGQLSLRDPIPGGATVLASPQEQRRIAELGAGVITKTGVLDEVAEIVRRQSDPYRVSDGSAPPLASRVIKVANAYDDLVGDSADRDRAAAVLERLRLDSAAEYDPTVIEALGHAVDRMR